MADDKTDNERRADMTSRLVLNGADQRAFALHTLHDHGDSRSSTTEVDPIFQLNFKTWFLFLLPLVLILILRLNYVSKRNINITIRIFTSTRNNRHSTCLRLWTQIITVNLLLTWKTVNFWLMTKPNIVIFTKIVIYWPTN